MTGQSTPRVHSHRQGHSVCSWTNLRWILLLIFVTIIMIQFMTNFTVYHTKIWKDITNNIFISNNGDSMKSDLAGGKFRNNIGNLSSMLNKTKEVGSLTQLTTAKTLAKTHQTLSGSSVVTVTTKPTVPVPVMKATPSSPGNEKGFGMKLCPPIPPGLQGPIKVDLNDQISWDELHKKYSELEAGGRWWPKTCKARSRVAIIIPYRNREQHLKVLLNNLHAMLQKQQLDYGFIVVEQNQPLKFNRAMLFNVGYAEALKKYPYQCFMFHDVDLIPENDKNIYSCPDQPRHMSVAIDKFGYNLPYFSIFGGVGALTKEQMLKTNGFSNKFWGWGGEDDDMSDRVRSNGYHISRYPKEISRYKMIKHGGDKGNQANPDRFRLLQQAHRRFKTDGINHLEGTYKVIKLDDRKMYTIIKVDLSEQAVART